MATVKKPVSKPMTYGEVENIWIQAGGNPQAASMAAAVADASSGFDPKAQYTNPDGSVGVGLWLIDKFGIPPGSTDPNANARAAIQQSQNGTDWSGWCSTWSDNACGKSGGSYLGEGSNALASLAQRAQPGSYNVIGAAPTGNGTSASTVNTSTTSTSSSGMGSKLLLVGGILVVSVGLFFLFRRQRAGGIEPTTTTVTQGV